MATGQKQFSLKDKHADLSPDDVRLKKDPIRPRIPATRVGEKKKKKNATARRAAAVKSNKNSK